MALAGTSATFPRQRLMQNFTLCEIPPMGGGLLAGAPERGRAAGAVRAARDRGSFPVVLGGDCPVMLGALAALQDKQDKQDQPGLLFVDGHEDAWPPLVSPTGEAADCELGLALGLFDAVLDQRLRGVLPRIRAADVIAIGPRDHDELAAAGVPTLTGQLRALIRPAGVHARTGAAA